ncbi:MAG: LysM peptidoglycan-binding domain-containing protein [Muribaculaceae bacterium]|nr:LysM peptidoglycan-binding domain-containing protein [Muribaculaceae bacterium]
MTRLTFFKSCAYVCLALACALPASADKKKNVLDIKESITDTNIVYPEANYEAESRKILEGWYMQNYMATDDRYLSQEDVHTSDDTYRKRLSELPTIIDMPFNQVVKSHIDRYTKKGRPMVASLLALSNYYMPIFEQALEEEGLPLELKYLPVIESALEPNAVSKHGATGLWQFMMIAAKGLNMEVNSLVDERRDPYVSSKKAAKFLKDLYNTYGDWSLAIAAYNCGPGNVNKALRRAGGDPSQLDFWAIYNYLPAETRGYVPAFIAANYVMTYYPQHNISPVIPKRPFVTDTIHINKRVHFNQIASVLDIPLEELRMLNPQFRADLIPGNSSKSYNLILPSQQVHAYIMSEEDILTYESEKYARRIDAEPGKVAGEIETTDELLVADIAQPESDAYREMAEAPIMKTVAPTTPAQTGTSTKTVADTRTIGPDSGQSKTHKVEPGESLASIAAKYGVGPEQLKEWNNLRRNSVRTGQVLKISGGNTPARQVQTASETNSRKSANATRKSEETKAASTQKSNTNVASRAESSSYKKKASADQQNTQSSKKKSKAGTVQATATAKKGAEAKKAAATPREHTVQSGESYERIAKKYGLTADELKKANNATSDMIKPDQKLKIPKKASEKATSTKTSSKKASTATSSKKSSKNSSSKKKSTKKK